MSDDRYEGPDQSDADLFDDESDVIDCPHCGQEIYAYAVKCPHCGVWLAMRHRDVKDINSSGPRKLLYQWWTWIVVLLVVAFVLWSIFIGL